MPMLQIKLIILIPSLVLSLLVGGFGDVLCGQDRATVEPAVLYELAIFQFLASESVATMEQYVIASPEVAAYALRRNIKLLQFFIGQEAFRKDEKVLAWDITLSYARLGKLADRLGKKEEASDEYSRALQASVRTGRRFDSVRDLLLLVDKLDTQYIEEKQTRTRLEK
jgi:hypothetical protein